MTKAERIDFVRNFTDFYGFYEPQEIPGYAETLRAALALFRDMDKMSPDGLEAATQNAFESCLQYITNYDAERETVWDSDDD